MKRVILGFLVFSALGTVTAQQPSQTFTWQPSPGHTQIPIWP